MVAIEKSLKLFLFVPGKWRRSHPKFKNEIPCQFVDGGHCIAYVCRLLGIGEFELRRWVDQFNLGTSDRRLSGQKQ